MTIKTFRGILTDGAQETIRLSTKQGKIGYRIIKFQLITNNPGGGNAEHCVKIFTLEQTTAPTQTIDFSDQTLLAVGIATNSVTGYSAFYNERIIFDNMVINQDIFITHHEAHSTESVNYYIEFEVMNLSDNETAVATLMDIRGSAEAPVPP